MSSLVFSLAATKYYDRHWQYMASYMCAFIWDKLSASHPQVTLKQG